MLFGVFLQIYYTKENTDTAWTVGFLVLFHFKENNWLNLLNVGKRVMNPNKAMNTFIINFFLINFLFSVRQNQRLNWWLQCFLPCSIGFRGPLIRQLFILDITGKSKVKKSGISKPCSALIQTELTLLDRVHASGSLMLPGLVPVSF